MAHLGYFHAEFVARRRWLDERAYADLVALCQFLPGPASSQVGMALELQRADTVALAAWAGFTLPSAIALILLALGLARHGDALPPGVLHGLKVVAVAVVAQAVWGMAGKLCHRPRPHHPDGARGLRGAGAADGVVAGGVIALAGWPGWRCSRAGGGRGSGPRETRRAASAGARAGPRAAPSASVPPAGVSAPDSGALGANTGAPGPRSGWLWLAAFLALLVGLPLLVRAAARWLAGARGCLLPFRARWCSAAGAWCCRCCRPRWCRPAGWTTRPSSPDMARRRRCRGRCSAFAAFLGAAAQGGYGGWLGGVVCLLAVFAPSFLLVAGALPFWERLRGDARMQAALAGINAAVVGLLLAALYQPVWTSAIHRPQDFALSPSWRWSR